MPRSVVIEFRKKYNLKRPPFDVLSIVEKTGIITEYYDHPEFNFAFSVRYGGCYRIFLPIVVGKCYHNYYAARELGHIVLGHFDHVDVDTLDEDRLTPQQRAKFRKEAEAFANELLMPIEWIWKAHNLNKNIQEVSDDMQVPTEVLIPHYKLILP